MSGTLGRMAPTAVTLLLIASCCWPQLELRRPGTRVRSTAELPRISSTLLAPPVEPAPDRDPFQPLHVRQDPPSQPENQATEVPPDQDTAVAATDTDGTDDPLENLVLNAVCIRGDRRVALINGQVCQQGKALPRPDSQKEPCIVAEVLADKVRLVHRGQTVELEYGTRDLPAALTAASPEEPVVPAGGRSGGTEDGEEKGDE